MSQIIRPILIGLSLLGLWFVSMALETFGAPVWALLLIGGLIVANQIALFASIYQVTRYQEPRDGEGGLQTPRSDVPDSGGGNDPTWWPELERELARYLAEHERSESGREQVPVGATETT